jgi:hypothetical protein
MSVVGAGRGWRRWMKWERLGLANFFCNQLLAYLEGIFSFVEPLRSISTKR